MFVVLAWWACAADGPGAAPEAWPVPVDARAAVTLDGWQRYFEALERGTLSSVLSDAATAVRDDPTADLAARAVLSAWVADAEVRRATGDRRGLTDVVRRVGGELDGDEFASAVAAVAGRPSAAIEAGERGRQRLDLGSPLQWFGLRFVDGPERRSLEVDPGASPLAERRRRSWTTRGGRNPDRASWP